MSTITAILLPDPDGTLHVPLPPDLRSGKVEIQAILRAASSPESPPSTAVSPPNSVALRKVAFAQLRQTGGLRGVIPDPEAWQREMRRERPLPGRD